MRDRATALVGITVMVMVAGCSSAKDEASPPQQAPAPTVSREHVVVVSKAPRGAVVVLEPRAPRDFPPPAGPAIMDQYGRAFIPSILIARVGQVVEFRNSEDVLHNVHVQRARTGAEVFNVDRPPFDVYKHTFDQAGFYDVQCDTHLDMRATIVVTATPYAGLADDRGTVTFPDVPPGSYTLRVFAAGTDLERVVEIAGPRTEVGVGAP